MGCCCSLPDKELVYIYSDNNQAKLLSENLSIYNNNNMKGKKKVRFKEVNRKKKFNSLKLKNRKTFEPLLSRYSNPIYN